MRAAKMDQRLEHDVNPMRSSPSHARLSRDAGGDDNDVSTNESLLKTVIGGKISSHLSGSSNVRDIGRDTRSVDDIVQPQLRRIG
jgi:hypothetical protein